MAVTIFERYEIKYKVSAKQRKKIEEEMADYVLPDAYGNSTNGMSGFGKNRDY